MSSNTASLDRRSIDSGSVRSRRRAGRVRRAGVVSGIAVAAGAAIWVFVRAPAVPVAAAPAAPLVTVAPPVKRDVAQTVDFTGQFSAVDTVDLRAQVSGYLAEIHFVDGQIVHRGDLLFVIDPRPYQIALQQASARYQEALAALDLADKQLARSTSLARDQFASREVVDQRTQARDAAVAALDEAKAGIGAAVLNLGFTRITAPFDGRISRRLVSIGSLVSGGPGAGSSTRLSSVVSLDPIHLDFDMSEADYLAYARSHLGHGPAPQSTIPVGLSDEAGFPRTGTLDFIDNVVDPGSGTMHARVSLPNPDLLIAPGQFARLRLPVSAPRPVLLVPDAALVADQSRELLMVAGADGVVAARQVETGALQGGGLREITAGLNADDHVIVDGLMRARPGSKVTTEPGDIASSPGG